MYLYQPLLTVRCYHMITEAVWHQLTFLPFPPLSFCLYHRNRSCGHSQLACVVEWYSQSSPPGKGFGHQWFYFLLSQKDFLQLCWQHRLLGHSCQCPLCRWQLILDILRVLYTVNIAVSASECLHIRRSSESWVDRFSEDSPTTI